MGAYRVYILNMTDHSDQPPRVLECDDDYTAIDGARQYADGKAVELWEGVRFIARLESDRE